MERENETEIPQELVKRYKSHYEEISGFFFCGDQPGHIAGIRGSGDRHLHGEAVLEVVTGTGKRLFYKPRDNKGAGLLGDVNEMLFGCRMVPEQIDGEGYAFQKAVDERIPADHEARKSYYLWLGRLTAVLYALGSTDMHGHNVICDGHMPVVVDTETVLSARAKGFGGSGEFSVEYGDVFPEYAANVGECMVLPRFFALRQNSPLIPSVDCMPFGYEECFIGGFSEGYSRIREKKEELSALINGRTSITVRYIMRSTRTYYRLEGMYRAAGDDAERIRVLDRLKSGLDGADEKRFKAVTDWEQKCIIEGDIPYFWLLSGERSVFGDLGKDALIREFTTVTPLENALLRIEKMNGQDLDNQLAYIRGSLRHIDIWEDEIARLIPPATYVPEELPDPVDKCDALSEAVEAMHSLWDERIPLSGGCCLWHLSMTRGRIGSLFGIAEGFSGIAVFCKNMADSGLLSGKDRKLAEKLSGACLADMVRFGRYLLDSYEKPPAEHEIARRYNGGFDFIEGLAGYLWALNLYHDDDPEEVTGIMNGFKAWDLDVSIGEAEYSGFLKKLYGSSEYGNDTLESGIAGRMAALLKAYEHGENLALDKAGRLGALMVERKRQRGCFTVFPEGRRQYFLPALMRGSLGPALVLLKYAEVLMKKVKDERKI